MITTAEMRRLEDKAEQQGTSRLILMERAGKSIAEAIQNRFKDKNTKILFICYHGNNGGDGFCAARYLMEADYNAKVFFIGKETKLKDEARTNHDMLMSINPDIFVKGFDIHTYDVIVDCILGTGTKGQLKENIATTVAAINESEAFKISIDVPTGINPDTGEESNVYVKADLTITMHDIKQGLKERKEKILILDLGLPS
ncbi:NAD(P)H-hydrate epimerase [Nanoarchaeota archaeon]